MLRITVGLFAMLVLVACGGDPKADPSPPQSTMTVAQACDEVARILPSDDERGGPTWEDFKGRFDDLKAAGTTQVQTSLAVLDRAVDAFAAGPAAGEEFLAARSLLLQELDQFNSVCLAAGSEAFQ